MTDIKHTECGAGTNGDGCGKEIGTENYVICRDGISDRTVTFHKRCLPQMSDVQKNHGVFLAPAALGFKPQDF